MYSYVCRDADSIWHLSSPRYHLFHTREVVAPLAFGTSPKGAPQVIFQIEDALCPGHILKVSMTQYDPNQDVLGTLLRRNGLTHCDDISGEYFKMVILIRNT